MADTNPNVEYLRGLAQIVREEGLSLLEVESEGWKLTLRGARPQVVSLADASASSVPVALPTAALPSSVPASSPRSAPAASAQEEALSPIVSPMVGVWYRAPSPSDPPFVDIGDRVEVGQTIGLVEAMKVFNEITAETSGVVAQIPAQAGALVETGQPLLLLRR